MKALVIGFGNVLRGDDGVGVRLVEELAEAWGAWSRWGVELRVVHQLTPELALEMLKAERVLFVDAWCGEPDVCGRAEPSIRPLADPARSDGSPHALDPAALVALARLLYGWEGEADLLRVPAHAFGHGATFSLDLRRVLPQARRHLAEWVAGSPQMRSGHGLAQGVRFGRINGALASARGGSLPP